ncbi:hypothetical protein K4K58_000382 [Colletotrichum sp. SAR11_239]|nr:hypothetical protein K4K58_000382 [Colletotrichum sp. SAR11_239]
MALLLAPYNNGMRLGQGFNSYTQQICIDDAVVVDPDRIENSVTNDGFTMRDLRLASGAGVDPNAGEDDHGNDESEDGVVIPVQESTEDVSGVTLTSGTTFAARSLMYQVEHRALSIRKLLEDVTSLENDLEDSQDLDPVAKKQKMELLEKKRIRLTKLKAQEASTTFPLLNAKSATKAGRSQVVTYTSRFVSKLSEVTDDMNISGSLSIKYGTIGGSGKGSFVDSNKFKESDLNFFISVKVINQSINIKDASVFQSLPSVNESKFTEVFGDCFISGFLEGGEFNALVSMKVLNQEQRTDITANAILTKYDSLRSFWALKPVNLIPIVYENAAIYTNTLLDAYMDFKNIYRNISSDLFDLQAGTKNFNKIILEEPFSTTKTLSKIDDESKFSPDYKGLDLARRACRFQMIKIVSEVDAVTKDPKLATDETRGEQFQSPVAFRERLPKISLARPSRKVAPLGDDEKLPQLLEGSRELLNDDEKAKVEDLEAEREDIGKNLRLAPLLGSREGSLFCNLDFLKPTFSLLQLVRLRLGILQTQSRRWTELRPSGFTPTEDQI